MTPLSSLDVTDKFIIALFHINGSVVRTLTSALQFRKSVTYYTSNIDIYQKSYIIEDKGTSTT